MDGYIIIFWLPHKKKNVELSKFCQKFYGQNTSSHDGKYHYRRHGLLDDISYRKLSRGVILVNEDDLDSVLEFLEKYEAHIYTREVKLTEEDKTIMQK
ncbi:MAG: hypothetical protein Q7J68_03755 [Thermoplasmata archaeon]|nr:hypothetical protein [Thermoplasmata archaeon]